MRKQKQLKLDLEVCSLDKLLVKGGRKQKKKLLDGLGSGNPPPIRCNAKEGIPCLCAQVGYVYIPGGIV